MGLKFLLDMLKEILTAPYDSNTATVVTGNDLLAYHQVTFCTLNHWAGLGFI
jgi:hypothetical protein